MGRVLSSLKTTLALVAALVGLSAWGSFAIQRHPEDYETIERGVLLEWLRSAGLAQPAASWWIAGMVLTAGLLSLNTVACVAGRLLRAWKVRRLSARSLSAHLAHLGFLLVLLAHLLGSVAGFRSDGHQAFEGQSFAVPARPGWVFDVDRVAVDLAPQGWPRDLSARIVLREAGAPRATADVRVNHPLFVDGAAVYLTGAQPTLRGWAFGLPDGRRAIAEVGRPLAVPGGELTLVDWSQGPDGRPALRLRWAPAGGPPAEGWLSPAPGQTLALPAGPALLWGDAAVATGATFDVRYDPGAPLALAGGALLSASLLPLLWPRRRPRGEAAAAVPDQPAPPADGVPRTP